MHAHLDNPIFRDDVKAREWLEAELWPHGPLCPHCSMLNTATKVHGKSGRPGLYMCNACRSQFTVTVGTLMERSKSPLHKWLCATYLLTSSKHGMSTHRLHDMLDVSLKSTWFLMHRIREALQEGGSPFTRQAGRGIAIRARPGAKGAGNKARKREPVRH
jgi:transposase-like protein